MADIELVIKIPEEIYKASKIIDVQYEDVVQMPLEVIANGTPLTESDDCVSREAVIDTLKKCEPLIDYDEHDRRVTYYEAEEVEFKIRTLPSVQSKREKGEWINPIDRLPNKSGLYLVSMGDLVTTLEFDGKHFRNALNTEFVVDAWLPLPKPYVRGE